MSDATNMNESARKDYLSSRIALLEESLVVESARGTRLQERISELEADNTRLREALRMYGAHQYDCEANQPCSCGFNEMRKALAPQPAKEGE